MDTVKLCLCLSYTGYLVFKIMIYAVVFGSHFLALNLKSITHNTSTLVEYRPNEPNSLLPLTFQPDTMLARVKSGGVAAPLRGCGSGPGLCVVSAWKVSGRGMSSLWCSSLPLAGRTGNDCVGAGLLLNGLLVSRRLPLSSCRPMAAHRAFGLDLLKQQKWELPRPQAPPPAVDKARRKSH
jgi:hypothetical protein